MPESRSELVGSGPIPKKSGCSASSEVRTKESLRAQRLRNIQDLAPGLSLSSEIEISSEPPTKALFNSEGRDRNFQARLRSFKRD